MRPAIGIDFGTTNSVVAAADADGRVTLLRHADDAVFRSVLCFWADADGTTRHAAGPRGIAAYLDDPRDSRLIMSMKSYLAQRGFTETRIRARNWTLEALIAAFLRDWLGPFQPAFAGARIVVGRPVRFFGDAPDDAFGEQRLRAAFAAAGHPDVRVALEPAGAGRRFARDLDRPTTVLVADFGGGTSDFSVLRFDPRAAHRVTPLGAAGIDVAGDALDHRILDRVVAPLLGKGGSYTVMGKALPIPPHWYSGFARWHLLSMMRAPRVLRDIREVARTAAQPERLHHFARLLEDEAGYDLYRAVAGVKAALSRADVATLAFRHADFVIDRRIGRAEFEAWIAPDLARIGATLDAALHAAATASDAIDRVFLTGGTSLVPAVRAVFERRFGAERIAMGGEFVSVAEGLALIGQEAD